MLAVEQTTEISQPSRRKRAIIYCRVSTDHQEQDGESLEYQEERCRYYAQAHDIEVIIPPLLEVKSGFIHYSFREKLTLARQMIRDGLADVIIVWDLRRFSRNFVHSAMIFEEVESAGGEVISVSENIDSSLTGKLIRSILAWSAESEREKILEYANRRWQTRIELGLPVGTGFPSYGWDWGDKEKTFYVLNPETAAVRFAIYQMFVELDMSIRSIAHKLTDDGIPTASILRNPNTKKGRSWTSASVFDILKDKESMGVLVICKQKNVIGPDGKIKRIPNPNMREIPGGIPAIVSPVMYERAQLKLKTNREEKSHLPYDAEQYLLKGHIYCGTCGYKMGPREHKGRAYYYCRKFANKYNRCPDITTIRAEVVNEYVWADCCRLFERIDLIQTKIEEEIERSVLNLLEDREGVEHIAALRSGIDYALQERMKHLEGSYYYNLITHDIESRAHELKRYEEEHAASRTVAAATETYKSRVLEFLDFINVMRGKYQDATFQEKRNALDVLGVKVYIRKTDDGEFGKKGFTPKGIEITYSPLFTGVNTSWHARYKSFQRSLTTVCRYSCHTTRSCTGSLTIAPVRPAARSSAFSTPSP
jgi:site-specific DNA recombinase